MHGASHVVRKEALLSRAAERVVTVETASRPALSAANRQCSSGNGGRHRQVYIDAHLVGKTVREKFRMIAYFSKSGTYSDLFCPS